MKNTIGILIASLMINVNLAHAQEAQDDEELARQTQNPVADLISLPFQNNTNFGLGPNDRTQNVLNIQPVIPFSMGENWNLVTRTIAPLITQPDWASTSGSTTGFGDILITAFVSPQQPGRLIWGLGPAISVPLGKEGLSAEKWAVGPSALVLTMSGPWVAGVLVNNIWSVGGDENLSDINNMLIQYFINYNFPSGWYLTSAPINTANWEADAGNKWTVPLGGGAGKVFRLGNRPINANAQAYYNVTTPDSFGAKWQFRFQVQFLFPQ